MIKEELCPFCGNDITVHIKHILEENKPKKKRGYINEVRPKK